MNVAIKLPEITQEEWLWLKQGQSAADLADFAQDYAAKAARITLRHHFAGLAMAAHIQGLSNALMEPEEWDKEVAHLAYRSADAMLKEGAA